MIRKFLMTVLVVLFSLPAMADSWEELLNSSIDGPISSYTMLEGTIYNANISFFIEDFDGDMHNFDGDDTVQLTIEADGMTLETPGPLTKDELTEWAKENAGAIFDAFFGSDPSTSSGGMPASTTEAVETSTTIQSIDISYFTGFSSEVKMSSEKSHITSGSNKIKASAGILNLKKQKEKFKYGLMIPYRYTNTDDNYSTRGYSLSFIPYYTRYQDINDKVTLSYTANLLAKVQYLESSLFPDGAGYYEYGYGLAFSPGYMLTKKLMLRGNLGYTWRKKEVPGEMVNGEMEWLVEAIKAVDTNEIVTLGVGLVYKPTDKFTATVETSRVKHLVKKNVPEDQDEAQYYVAEAKYKFSFLELGLGYKTVQEVKDYSEHTYQLTLGLSF